MIAGGRSTLLSSQGHQALEGESEDGSSNGSKFLLLLAARPGYRSWWVLSLLTGTSL